MQPDDQTETQRNSEEEQPLTLTEIGPVPEEDVSYFDGPIDPGPFFTE